MLSRRVLVLLVVSLALLAALAGSSTPAAQAKGCGLSVKAPSKAHVNQTYAFTIKWNFPQHSSTGSGVVKWGVGSPAAAINAVRYSDAPFYGYALSLVSHSKGSVKIYFSVDTGICQEVFSRTVKVS